MKLHTAFPFQAFLEEASDQFDAAAFACARNAEKATFYFGDWHPIVLNGGSDLPWIGIPVSDVGSRGIQELLQMITIIWDYEGSLKRVLPRWSINELEERRLRGLLQMNRIGRDCKSSITRVLPTYPIQVLEERCLQGLLQMIRIASDCKGSIKRVLPICSMHMLEEICLRVVSDCSNNLRL